MATEFSGIAAIGDLLHVSRWFSRALPAALLFVLVATGAYRRVEVVFIAAGLFELVFLWLAWRAHPQADDVLRDFAHPPLGQSERRVLIAADMGR